MTRSGVLADLSLRCGRCRWQPSSSSKGLVPARKAKRGGEPRSVSDWTACGAQSCSWGPGGHRPMTLLQRTEPWMGESLTGAPRHSNGSAAALQREAACSVRPRLHSGTSGRVASRVRKPKTVEFDVQEQMGCSPTAGRSGRPRRRMPPWPRKRCLDAWLIQRINPGRYGRVRHASISSACGDP